MKGSVLVFVLLLGVVAVRADPRAWDPTGLAVRQGSHLEWQRASARDVAGNTLIVWSDTRLGMRNIYAQLVNSQGVPQWATDGVRVSGDPGYHKDPAVCAVDDGWIIAWNNDQTGLRCPGDEYSYLCGVIWAQKLSDAGTALWTPGGVPVDTLAVVAWSETIHAVSDGNGGAIIAWLDTRDGNISLYAQRVLSTGQTGWTSDLQVADFPLRWANPDFASDGNGNMFVVSHALRGGSLNIYASKITADGQLPWGEQDGVVVCDTIGQHENPAICSDGSGGCYVAWQDTRNSSLDLYMQRLNSGGAAQWATNGVVLCNGPNGQYDVRLATSMDSDTADGCVAVWEDARVNNNRAEIYAQKISLAGDAQWTLNGIHVCGDANPEGSGNTRENVRLVSDLSGGLICAWEDTRNSDDDLQGCDVYGARILANGTLSWNGQQGNLIADGSQAQNTLALQVDAAGALIAYNDSRTGSGSLRLQKVALGNGSLMLPDSGTVLFTSLDQSTCEMQAISMTPARTAIVWSNGQSWNPRGGLYYQIVTSNGAFEKPVNGVQLAPDNEGYEFLDQENASLCSDGNGGFFCCYEDNRTGTKKIRLSHVNSDGDIVGSQAGTVVYFDQASMSDQFDVHCASDGEGGCFVAWSQYDFNYIVDAWVMRMNANGEPAWPQAMRMTNTADDDIVYGLVSNPDGCCIAVWRSGEYWDFNISAAKVCGDRTMVFDTSVCDAPQSQEYPAIVADNQGGAYFAWSDRRRNGSIRAVYAQHLNSAGTESWVHNGVPVNVDTLYQTNPALALGEDGNLFVVWEDYRSNQSLDLYAQKLSPSGTLLWPDSGLMVCNVTGDQTYPTLLPDNGSGLFLAWTDYRSPEEQIYATHLDGDGNPVGDAYWQPHGGGALTDPTNQEQTNPCLVFDGAGGCIAVWSDNRSSDADPYSEIYAQHVSDAAGVRDHANAVPSAYSLAQNYPNPFNPVTQISFALPKVGLTNLTVYDLLGRRVATLVQGSMSAGEHSVTFDANRLASGIYFYRIESGRFTATKKMVLLK
jgi:hypothetical protein